MEHLSLETISSTVFTFMLQVNKKILDPHAIIKTLVLPPSHTKVVFYLFHHGSTSVSKIAKDLCISKPNMTPILDNLIVHGYINRANSPDDRRIILIELTEEGKFFFKSIQQLMEKNLEAKLATLSASDLAILDDAIKTLSTIINKIT
ncbi:MAG: MarR family winged helix-turn-helix transcriptional regulator [Cellulosilyticaceae bacterium]